MSESAGRKIYYLSAIAIVAIVLISAIAITRPISISVPSATAKTLQVTGVGTVSAAPDEAVLLLAVQTQADTAAKAASDNAASMNRVMEALINAGIGKESIETASYSLMPIYEYKPEQTGPSKLIGYVARNAIQVTVSDFSRVGLALDSAVNAGVNEVQGVMFTLSNEAYSELEKQALQMALRDADSKAKATASTLGLRLVGPISITPGYVFQPVLQKLGSEANQTPIQPGTLQVTATVQVIYEIA